MWDQSGGYFVPLELQARWIAYTWGGAIPAPDPARSAVEAYRHAAAFRRRPDEPGGNDLRPGRRREPRSDSWPQLRRALLFGPLAPSCFRLEGPDALPDAADRFARDAAAFGAITGNELSVREQAYWNLLAGAHARL